jgi:hypothetical protein
MDGEDERKGFGVAEREAQGGKEVEGAGGSQRFDSQQEQEKQGGGGGTLRQEVPPVQATNGEMRRPGGAGLNVPELHGVWWAPRLCSRVAVGCIGERLHSVEIEPIIVGHVMTKLWGRRSGVEVALARWIVVGSSTSSSSDEHFRVPATRY